MGASSRVSWGAARLTSDGCSGRARPLAEAAGEGSDGALVFIPDS